MTPSLWIWTCVGPEDSYCFLDRHVFNDTGLTGAPPDNAWCVCGAQTWREAVEAAWKRYTAKTNRSQEPLP